MDDQVESKEMEEWFSDNNMVKEELEKDTEELKEIIESLRESNSIEAKDHARLKDESPAKQEKVKTIQKPRIFLGRFF